VGRLQVIFIKGKVRPQDSNISMTHESLQVIDTHSITQTHECEGAPKGVRGAVAHARTQAYLFQ
jgi:hypothetical protein